MNDAARSWFDGSGPSDGPIQPECSRCEDPIAEPTYEGHEDDDGVLFCNRCWGREEERRANEAESAEQLAAQEGTSMAARELHPNDFAELDYDDEEPTRPSRDSVIPGAVRATSEVLLRVAERNDGMLQARLAASVELGRASVAAGAEITKARRATRAAAGRLRRALDAKDRYRYSATPEIDREIIRAAGEYLDLTSAALGLEDA